MSSFIYSAKFVIDDDGCIGWPRSRHLPSQNETAATYHRRPMACGCIRAGDTDGGGLDMEMPVAGLMIGMALRARVAAG
jgi:hypothetical protein